jgi:hypothetical protein
MEMRFVLCKAGNVILEYYFDGLQASKDEDRIRRSARAKEDFFKVCVRQLLEVYS